MYRLIANNDMNKYLEMKKRHQDDVDNFPMFFAFNEKQFDEGMRSLGLAPTEKSKICRVGSTGGYILKTDSDKLYDMLSRHEVEMKDAIKTDDAFIFEMFRYELDNHEYSYTGEISDTLIALGLSMKDIDADERLKAGLRKAQDYVMGNCD